MGSPARTAIFPRTGRGEPGGEKTHRSDLYGTAFVNPRSGRILASLLFTSAYRVRVSAGMGLPSETNIEPDRRLSFCLQLSPATYGSVNSNRAHPPPPGHLSGICHFSKKMLQMPHGGGGQHIYTNQHGGALRRGQNARPMGQDKNFI